MKKIFLSIIICIGALFLMSGCVEITYGFYVNSDGSVEKKYEAVIDPEGDFGIHSADYALEIATAQLEGMLEEEPDYGEIIVSTDNPYDVSLVYSYSDITEYYRAMGLTGDEKPEPENSVIDKDFLYRYDTFTVFDGYDNEYGESWAESFRYNVFSDITEIPYDDIDIVLEYGTKYTKMYSSNAQLVRDNNGANVYVWECKLDELNDVRTMTAKQPNFVNWYLMSICASVVTSVILFVLVRKKGGNNGRKQNSL